MRIVVGHGQRVGVEHHALETCVGAHVFADLFAHETGIAPGGKAVEQDPECFPRAEVGMQRFGRQRLDRGEIADEGEAGPQCNRKPHGVLEPAFFELVDIPGGFVEFLACEVVAFQPFLHPHENFGVHGLRAGIAAPKPSCYCGKQEQRQCRQDQDAGEIYKILRPEHQVEDIELARGQVEQHCLPVIPLQPGQAVIERLGQQYQRDPPVGEHTVHRARLDFLLDRVELLFDRGVGGGGRFVLGHCVFRFPLKE